MSCAHNFSRKHDREVRYKQLGITYLEKIYDFTCPYCGDRAYLLEQYVWRDTEVELFEPDKKFFGEHGNFIFKRAGRGLYVSEPCWVQVFPSGKEKQTGRRIVPLARART